MACCQGGERKEEGEQAVGEDSEEEEPLPGFAFGEFVPSKKHAELILMGIACNVTGSYKSTNATDKACLELVMRAGENIE